MTAPRRQVVTHPAVVETGGLEHKATQFIRDVTDLSSCVSDSLSPFKIPLFISVKTISSGVTLTFGLPLLSARCPSTLEDLLRDVRVSRLATRVDTEPIFAPLVPPVTLHSSPVATQSATNGIVSRRHCPPCARIFSDVAPSDGYFWCPESSFAPVQCRELLE